MIGVLGVKCISGVVGMAARPGHPTPHAKSCCPRGYRSAQLPGSGGFPYFMSQLFACVDFAGYCPGTPYDNTSHYGLLAMFTNCLIC